MITFPPIVFFIYQMYTLENFICWMTIKCECFIFLLIFSCIGFNLGQPTNIRKLGFSHRAFSSPANDRLRESTYNIQLITQSQRVDKSHRTRVDLLMTSLLKVTRVVSHSVIHFCLRTPNRAVAFFFFCLVRAEAKSATLSSLQALSLLKYIFPRYKRNSGSQSSSWENSKVGISSQWNISWNIVDESGHFEPGMQTWILQKQRSISILYVRLFFPPHNLLCRIEITLWRYQIACVELIKKLIA